MPVPTQNYNYEYDDYDNYANGFPMYFPIRYTRRPDLPVNIYRIKTDLSADLNKLEFKPESNPEFNPEFNNNSLDNTIVFLLICLLILIYLQYSGIMSSVTLS